MPIPLLLILLAFVAGVVVGRTTKSDGVRYPVNGYEPEDHREAPTPSPAPPPPDA